MGKGASAAVIINARMQGTAVAAAAAADSYNKWAYQQKVATHFVFKSHRQPPLLITPATLSRALGVPPTVPESLMAWLAIPLTCRLSLMVVRRLCFVTAAVRGLKTLLWSIDSFCPLTMRRA